MDQLTKSPESVQPYDITQFVRGKLYILIDCLLTNVYTKPKEDLSFAINFFLDFIEFAVHFLKEEINMMPDVNRCSEHK